FAITIAWNTIGLRYVERDREFLTMASTLAARIGKESLFVVRPTESLLGAIPFYTGRIPRSSRNVAELPRDLAGSGARFLLAPLSLRDSIAAELGPGATVEETLTADDD